MDGSSSILTTLLLCGLMGLVGQGIRAVVGLKNSATTDESNPTAKSSFSAAYLFVSLMIGFIAGILAGIGVGLKTVTSVQPDDLKILLGIAVAGYAGTDFIEGAFSNIIPGLSNKAPTTSQDSQLPVRSAPVNASDMMFATHLKGSGQSIVAADDIIGMLDNADDSKTGSKGGGGAANPDTSLEAAALSVQSSTNVTSNDWTSAELARDMNLALQYGAFIKASAAAHGLTPSLVCAVGSRESNWGQSPDMRPKGPAGTGDWAKRKGLMPPDGLGWGRGLMQADYAASDFAKDPTKWKDPEQNIEFGCNELEDDIKYFRRANPALSDYDNLRAAVAAYNTGPGNVEKSIKAGRDVDSSTAGHDYSKDVFSRAAWFKANGFDDKIAAL